MPATPTKTGAQTKAHTKAKTGADEFQRDAIEVVSNIRDRFARILELKCPGSRAVTPLCDAFGIHRKLAWQLTKVAYADDAFAAARHMPPMKSLDAWFAAAAKRGVPKSLIEPAREAGARFETLAETHASSKAEFEMLLESCADEPDDTTDAKWRQHAFLGNSFTWGAQCRTQLGFCILMPSDDREHYFHAVQIKGLFGYRQTRPGVRWIVNQGVVADADADKNGLMERVPLDPDAARAHKGVPVLPSFCSDPMPALERRQAHGGIVQDEFAPAEVGLTGERTLVTGEIVRNTGAVHATAKNRRAYFGTAIRTPSEVVLYDMFVKRGLFGDVKREPRVFSDLGSSVAFGVDDILHTSARLVHLGNGLGMAHTPDIRGYADLCRSVCDTVGIEPEQYELFRLRIEYPPMPSSVMVSHAFLDLEDIGSTTGTKPGA